MPNVYEELINERRISKRRLSELELARLGWTHADAAASLCRNWRLPEVFASLIERHASPQELLKGSKPVYDAACVAVAAMLPACCDEEWPEQHLFFNSLQTLMQNVKVDYAQIFARVDDQCAEFAPLLKLAPPERTLSQWFLTALKTI